MEQMSMVINSNKMVWDEHVTTRNIIILPFLTNVVNLELIFHEMASFKKKIDRCSKAGAHFPVPTCLRKTNSMQIPLTETISGSESWKEPKLSHEMSM
jgi:hypothetical protein